MIKAQIRTLNICQISDLILLLFSLLPQADRKWDTMGHKQSDSAAPTRLDFSEGPDPIEGGSATDAGTATESDSAAVRGKPGGWWGGSAAASDSDASAVRRGHQGVSHMDVEEDSEFEDVDEELLAVRHLPTLHLV